MTKPESCSRYPWCVRTGPHFVCEGPDTGEDIMFVIDCDRCSRGIRTLFLYRDENGKVSLDTNPDQLVAPDDTPVDINPTAPGERMEGQILTMNGDARARWVFTCDACGITVRCRHDRLEPFLVNLIGHGVSQVSLEGLRGYMLRS